MSVRIQRVSPFLAAAQSTSSEVLEFADLVFAGLSDAIEASTFRLRPLRNVHFRREEVLHDEGQLFAIYPKKLSQVSLIDRVSPSPLFHS